MRFRPEDDDSSIPLPPPMPKRGTVDGANCAECPFAACGKPNRPVVGEGIESPDWLIVGEGPGQNEIALGRPFVGASGQLVNKALAAVGFPRDRLYITNATLCVPTPGATESQKAKARACCSARFIAEMAQFPEKPVLALGAIAAQAFLGDETTIGAVAGCTYEARVAGAALRAHGQITTATRKITGEKHEKLDDKEELLRVLAIEHAQSIEANPELHVNCDKPKGKGRCDTIKAIDRLNKSADKLYADVAALTDEIAARDAQAVQMAAELDASEPLRLVVPSTHPAAIIRGGSGVAGAHSPDLAFTNLVYDVSKVVALAAGKNIRFKYDIETAYTTPEEIELLIEKIFWAARKARFVAVDTETYVEDTKRHNALQTRHAKIRAIGLATPEFSVSIAWKLANQRTRALVGALLADAMIRKVMHNRIYDCPVLANNGYPVRGPVDDTLLLHHCAFPGLAHGLQQTATMFFAMPGWKAEFRAGDDTMPDLTRYNAIDTLATARLHAPLTIAVKRTQTERAYEMDNKMAIVAAKMGEVGAPISREVNQQLLEQFTANMKAARERIEEKAYAPEILPKLWERLAVEQGKRQRKGDSPIFEERVTGRLNAIREAHEKGKWAWSISTSDHIIAYLKARGVPMYQQTDKGKTQCKKDTLELFSHLPEVRAILDFRENQKLLSTFCYRMFDRVKGKKTLYGFTDTDGRIHPRWNVHRITSRWSAEAPSCQNWPKADKKKGRPNLRTQVVAPPGRVFVGFDMAQLEARIIALLSGDKFLVDIFAQGKDIHSEFARVVLPGFDSLSVDVRKKLRDQIKRLEYGAFYGGQADSLFKKVAPDFPDLKLADVARLVQMMTVKMTGVIAWHQNLLRQVAVPPYQMRSLLLDRVRNSPLGNVDMNEVYNWPVQTCGSEIVNTGVAHMEERAAKYRDCWAILQIHDAVVYECDEDDADKVRVAVEDCFTQELTNAEMGVTVAFPAEAKIGRDWSVV